MKQYVVVVTFPIGVYRERDFPLKFSGHGIHFNEEEEFIAYFKKRTQAKKAFDTLSRFKKIKSVSMTLERE